MSIIWLASYPKSGNTWMRVLLSNYLRNCDDAVDINELEKTPIASAHSLFERYAGVESSDLTPDEIDACRPDLYRLLAQDGAESRFVKVHDAYTLLPDGRPMFPSEVTQGAIYIVRNPLDVAVSMMYHMDDADIDKAIARMATDKATLAASAQRGNIQFRQKLLTWSDHVRSWLDSSKPFPVHLVRYEDMQHEPGTTFGQALAFAGLSLHGERLERAIRFSQFDVLQQQEVEHGFRERRSVRAPFFRRGRVGGWRDHFTPAQTRQLIADHSEVMGRLGYLSPAGELVY